LYQHHLSAPHLHGATGFGSLASLSRQPGAGLKAWPELRARVGKEAGATVNNREKHSPPAAEQIAAKVGVIAAELYEPAVPLWSETCHNLLFSEGVFVDRLRLLPPAPSQHC